MAKTPGTPVRVTSEVGRAKTPPFPPTVAIGAWCEVHMTQAMYPKAHPSVLAARHGRMVAIVGQEPVWASSGFHWSYMGKYLDDAPEGFKGPKKYEVEAFHAPDLIVRGEK